MDFGSFHLLIQMHAQIQPKKFETFGQNSGISHFFSPAWQQCIPFLIWNGTPQVQFSFLHVPPITSFPSPSFPSLDGSSPPVSSPFPSTSLLIFSSLHPCLFLLSFLLPFFLFFAPSFFRPFLFSSPFLLSIPVHQASSCIFLSPPFCFPTVSSYYSSSSLPFPSLPFRSHLLSFSGRCAEGSSLAMLNITFWFLFLFLLDSRNLYK